MTGLEMCLQLDAEGIVIVHVDNQYRAADIRTITAPVLAYEADMVLVARPITESAHYSWFKKRLPHPGSGGRYAS